MMTLQMIKPLFMPPSKKVTGLKVWCDDCGTNVDAICKKNGKPIRQCPHPEKLSYKVYAHQPGTKNGRRTKKLSTRSIEEAQHQAQEFRKQVREGSLEEKNIRNSEIQKPVLASTAPLLLSHLAAKHIAFLEGDAPAHQFHAISTEYLTDIERSYKVLLEVPEKNGYHDLEITDLNNEIVGILYTHLIKVKKFGNRNFNKYIGYWQRLLDWGIEEFELPIKNLFKKIPRKPVTANPHTISQEEFESFLQVISPENGKRQYPNEEHPRYLHRNYLNPAYRLLLFSGRRVNEILELKHSDVIEDEKGNTFIKVPDLKVSRIQGLAENKEVYVPVTRELRQLLFDLDYEKYKQTDRYLIAPEVERNRGRVMCDDLSRAFTHYFSQVSEKKLTLKSLRKTFITAAHLYTGGNAKLLSGHSDNAVINKHYLDQKAVAIASQSFEVFPQTTPRDNELNAIRSTSKKQQLKMEVSK